MWTLQRWLLVRKVKGVVTLYSRFSMHGAPDIKRIEAGEMLPLECNPTEDRAVDEVSEASRKASSTLAVVQSRTQALVFTASCDEERAKDYVMELWQDGWGDLQPVTELPRRGKDRIKAAIRKAFARYKSVILDVYSLRGPVARAATQVFYETSEPSEPDLPDIDAEIRPEMDADPFELELEIERELDRE